VLCPPSFVAVSCVTIRCSITSLPRKNQKARLQEGQRDWITGSTVEAAVISHWIFRSKNVMLVSVSQPALIGSMTRVQSPQTPITSASLLAATVPLSVDGHPLLSGLEGLALV